jgi:hypothetical protein
MVFDTLKQLIVVNDWHMVIVALIILILYIASIGIGLNAINDNKEGKDYNKHQYAYLVVNMIISALLLVGLIGIIVYNKFYHNN